MTEFILASGDDWEGLYAGGVLVTEGHSIPLHELAKIFIERQPVKTFVQREVSLDWLHDEGSLPLRLDEVHWQD